MRGIAGGVPALGLLLVLSTCQLTARPEGAREQGAARFAVDLARRTREVLGSTAAPLSFAHCLEAALEHNLELRSEAVLAQLARERTGRELLALLPSLPVRLEGSYRNRKPYTRSTYLLGRGGLRDSYATAAEKDHFFLVAGLAWSPLDFGLSFYTACQERLAESTRETVHRRVAQKVAGTLFTAWCHLLAARRADPLLARAREEAQGRVDQAERLRRRREGTALDMSPLLEELARRQDAAGRNREVRLRAKAVLAENMGIDPRADLRVERGLLHRAPPLPPLAELIGRSLISRPELHGADLERERAKLEIRKAWLGFFPNVQLFHEFNHDDNEHLLYDDFYRVGARLTGDLLRIVAAPSLIREARLGRDLVENELHLVSLNILVQVRLARLDLARALEQDALARRELAAAERAAELEARAAAGRAAGTERRRTRIELLAARAAALAARRDAWSAYGELLVAVGDTSPLLGAAR